jgi:hypothetical protein
MVRYYYANISISAKDHYIFTEMLSTLKSGYKLQRSPSSKLINSSLLDKKCELMCLINENKKVFFWVFFLGGGDGIKKQNNKTPPNVKKWGF